MGRRKRFKNERYIPEFTEGVIYAASWLVQTHDRPTIAKEILSEVGVDEAWFKECGKQLEPTERKNLRKIFP